MDRRDDLSLHAMDHSFPCVGNLEDGIFDLALDDGCRGTGEESKAGTPTTCTPSVIRHPAMEVSSPDTLDLALMTFTAGREKHHSDCGVHNEPYTSSTTLTSPFCDAVLRGREGRRNAPLSGAVFKDPPKRLRAKRSLLVADRSKPCCSSTASSGGGGSGVRHESTQSPRIDDDEPPLLNFRESSQLHEPERREPPNANFQSLRRTCSTALSPTQPCVAESARGVEAVREGGVSSPGLSLDHPLSVLDTGNTRTKRAGERHIAHVVEATTAQREEQALEDVDRAAAACVFKDIKNAANVVTGSRSAVKKGRVSFLLDHREPRVSKMLPSASGYDDKEGWAPEPDQRAGTSEGADEDDILFKASDLHSAVAGQLRSVNELLKRKCYFYIDTSWNAKQLPCPPAAWTSKGVRDANAVGVGRCDAERRPEEAISRARRRSLASSDVNLAFYLEGRWAMAGTAKPKVGVFTISGNKVHDPTWKCQDSSTVVAPLDRGDDQALFAVFDGHGANGRQASRVCMDRLPKYLVSMSRSGDPATALRRSCQRLHRDLATGVAGDCELSGTTLCAAVLTGRKLTVANVGDSGCLLLSRAAGLDNLVGHFARDLHCVGGGTCGEFGTAEKGMSKTLCSVERNPQFTGHHLAVEQLSHDHKPECTGELERIRAAGGMVCPVPCGNRYYPDTEKIGKGRPPVNEGRCADWPEREGLLAARDFGRDVSRVWRASGGGPGLAMSRSIGDKMAHRVGVTHEPDVTEIELHPRNEAILVLATDGVWDVLGAEDIRKATEAFAVHANWCPQALSEDICRKSLSEWAMVSTGGSDDITCLVVKMSSIAAKRRTSPVLAGEASKI